MVALGRVGTGRVFALALVLTITVPSTGLGQDGLKSNRRWIFGTIGALSLGIPAYAFTTEGAFNSTCTSRSCAGVVAAFIGGVVGFLIGSEMDSRYKRRMAAGPSLDYTFRDVPLDLIPDRMAEFPGGAAVIGLGGARVVRRDGSVSARGSGVRGIEDVAVLPAQDLLVLSTIANLISFSMASDTAQGQVIDERGGGSMQAFEDRLAVAGLDSLRLLRVEARDDEPAIETLARVETMDFVTDMAFSSFGRIGWVLIEDRLSSYNGSLEKLGEIALPAAGRAVRARGQRLVVAAGTNGVFVLDATDPVTPRVVSHYTGLRFAYSADLDGDLLYVAGGTEGVAVVDVSGPEPRVLGVARESRFVTDLVATGSGEVWILDRDGRRVQIADFALEGMVSKSGSSR